MTNCRNCGAPPEPVCSCCGTDHRHHGAASADLASVIWDTQIASRRANASLQTQGITEGRYRMGAGLGGLFGGIFGGWL